MYNVLNHIQFKCTNYGCLLAMHFKTYATAINKNIRRTILFSTKLNKLLCNQYVNPCIEYSII